MAFAFVSLYPVRLICFHISACHEYLTQREETRQKVMHWGSTTMIPLQLHHWSISRSNYVFTGKKLHFIHNIYIYIYPYVCFHVRARARVHVCVCVCVCVCVLVPLSSVLGQIVVISGSSQVCLHWLSCREAVIKHSLMEIHGWRTVSWISPPVPSVLLKKC